MWPSGKQWCVVLHHPSAACEHFGLLTVFFHLWEATATSQTFSASLNPEEDQLPSFPEGRVTPPHPSPHCLQAKMREHYRFCFWSEGLKVGHLRMDWGTTEVLTIPGRRPTGCCSRIRRLVMDEVFNIKVGVCMLWVLCGMCVLMSHEYWKSLPWYPAAIGQRYLWDLET